jgi:hypothetical protein
VRSRQAIEFVVLLEGQGFAGQRAPDIGFERAEAGFAHRVDDGHAQHRGAVAPEFAVVGAVVEAVDHVRIDVGDHGGQRVGDGAQARFAFAQRQFGVAQHGDVVDGADEALDAAVDLDGGDLGRGPDQASVGARAAGDAGERFVALALVLEHGRHVAALVVLEGPEPAAAQRGFAGQAGDGFEALVDIGAVAPHVGAHQAEGRGGGDRGQVGFAGAQALLVFAALGDVFGDAQDEVGLAAFACQRH